MDSSLSRESRVCNGLFHILVLSAAMVFGGCTIGGGGGIEPKNPRNVGMLSVGLYYGGGFTTGTCKGSGTVTIESTTGQRKEAGYGFTGLPLSTAPGCRTSIQPFTMLEPGLWTISVSSYGGTCTKQVQPGLQNTIDIGLDFGSLTCS